jgi:hypothetical protein
MTRPSVPSDLERLVLRQTRAVRTAADRFGAPGRMGRLSAVEYGEIRGLICDLRDIVDGLGRHLAEADRDRGSVARTFTASLAYLAVGRVVTPPKRRHHA